MANLEGQQLSFQAGLGGTPTDVLLEDLVHYEKVVKSQPAVTFDAIELSSRITLGAIREELMRRGALQLSSLAMPICNAA